MRYEISLDEFIWSTSDDKIAAAQAPNIARQYGGAEMVITNDHGGGRITVYDGQGRITKMRGLPNDSEN